MMDGYPQAPTEQNIIHTPPAAPTNRGYLILDNPTSERRLASPK